MGKIIVCETKTTTKPFTFENTKVEIFSYEELCYYIYHNIALLNEDFLTVPFLSWLKETGMDDLAQRMVFLIEKNADLEEILVEILRAGNYYSLDEVKSFMGQYERFFLLRSYERAKLRGDSFLMYRRYMKAAAIYESILENESEIGDTMFIGKIYHNRGIALAHNMQMVEAKRSFLHAYSLTKKDECLKEYFFVCATIMDEEGLKKEVRKYQLPDEYYESILSDVEDSKADVKGSQIYHRLDRALYNRRKGNVEDYRKRMDNVLRDIKSTFREQTI